MPNLTADQVIKQGHKRNFIQFGGARPNNPVRYAGQDAQYMAVGGVKSPESGNLSPIWVPHPYRPGQFKMVGRTIAPPDLASASVRLREEHGYIPRQLARIGCQFTIYEPTGTCKDPSDFLNGWTDYIHVFSNGLVTDKDLGDRNSFDKDDTVEDVLTVSFASIYPLGGLMFGEGASAEITREAVDVVYGSQVQCGDCGPQNDGTGWIYAVTKSSGAGSPGMPAELVYSLDGGATWNQTNITGLGATADPTGIDIVGNNLVVLVNSEGAYYYAALNTYTGVPGSWTKVTTGFVAAKGPNDLFVLGPREIFIVGDGGYIYKSTDITAGVSVLNAGSATTNNLSRIHGTEDVLVAVGASGTVLKSTNRGATWAAVTTNPASLWTIAAVCALDKLRYWVGTVTNGRLFYTLNGGETWTEKNFSGSGSGSVRDIVAPTDEVIYFSHDTTTPTARVFASWNGGSDWTKDAPRLLNWPTFNRANRLAFPNIADQDPGTAANNLAVAGLAGDGIDGVLYLGVAGRL